MHVMLFGASLVGLPHTSFCAGTNEMSCWMLKLTQSRFRGEPADSQTLSALHFSPGSQSVLVSHDLPDPDELSPLSDFSPVSHVPALQASPSPHSRSFSQLAPHPLAAFLLLQPGNPGGQSALSLHFTGAGRPGRCAASPEISFWIETRFGALRVPLVPTTSPSESVAWT